MDAGGPEAVPEDRRLDPVQLAEGLKALADITRLRMVRLLLRRELAVGELVDILGYSQPRVSRQLKVLVDAGLLSVRRDGRWAFYAAVGCGPGRQLLNALAPLLASCPELDADIAAAERLRREGARRTARRFSDLAQRWAQVSAELLGSFDLCAAIAQALPRPLASVADLGCGPGQLLARLRQLHGPELRLIGVDNAPGMIDAARSSFAADPHASIRMGELEHLPLTDGETRAVVLSLTLRHLADPARAVAEAGRVVAPGGAIVIAELDRHQREELRTRYGDRRLGMDEAEVLACLSAGGFGAPHVRRFGLANGLTLVLYRARRNDAPGGQGGRGPA